MQKKIKNIVYKISKMLNIKPPKIIFGAFNHSFYTKGVCHIHLYDSYNKTLFLALHELRHHYQYAYMMHIEDSISNKIKEEWNRSVPYETSYIEGDAYTFSLFVFQMILHIPYKIENKTKEIIMHFLRENSFIFSIFL